MPEPLYDPDSGFAVVEGLLSPDEVASVLADCEQLLALPPEQRHARDKVAQGTQHLEALDERSNAVAELVTLASLLVEVEAIVGPNALPQVISYRSPQPGYGSQKLHTDDLPKLDHGPDRVATAIVALTEFTEANGSTRVVPGSHRRPDLQRVAGGLDSHPDEISLTGLPGTAFIFSGHLLHSGTQNNSTAERPALQLTWRSR